MDDKPTSPFLVESFTILADFDEDRLRMNAIDAEGRTTAIWLTRRMLDRFVPGLTQHAESRAPATMPKELSLSFSQQKLRQERQANPAKPVLAPVQEVQAWLCTTIELGQRKNGSVWILQGRTGQEARMFLAEAHVRATLDVLLHNYRALDWPCDKFPGWIIEDTAPKPQNRTVMH